MAELAAAQHARELEAEGSRQLLGGGDGGEGGFGVGGGGARPPPPISERSVSSGSCHVPVIAASGPPLDAPLRVIATARTRIGRFGGVGHAVTQSVLQDRNDGIGILECTCHAASLGVEIVPTSVATAQDQQQLGGRRQGGSGLARSSGSGSWSRDGLSGLARSSGSGSWSRDGLSGGEGGAGVSRQASGGGGWLDSTMASDFGRPSRHLRGSRDWAQAELGVPPPQQQPPQPGSGGGSGGGGSGRGGGSSSSGGGKGAGGGGGNGPSHPDELGAFRTVALPPPRPLWSCPASLDLALKYHHELRSTLAPRLRAVAARLEKSSFHLDEAVPTLDLTSLVEAASTGGAVGGGAAGKGGVHEEGAPVGRGTALPTPPPPSATSAEIAAAGALLETVRGLGAASDSFKRLVGGLSACRLSLLLSSLSTTQQQLERAHLSRHFLTRRFDFERRCTAVPPPGSSVEWIAEQLGKNLIGGRAIKSAARLATRAFGAPDPALADEPEWVRKGDPVLDDPEEMQREKALLKLGRQQSFSDDGSRPGSRNSSYANLAGLIGRGGDNRSPSLSPPLGFNRGPFMHARGTTPPPRGTTPPPPPPHAASRRGPTTTPPPNRGPTPPIRGPTPPIRGPTPPSEGPRP